MLLTFLTVVPIFAVIFAGWLARRIGVLGPQATSEVNRFVVYLALPALMFDVVARSQPEEIWRPDFIAAFAIGAFAVFTVTIALSVWRGHGLATAAVDGLGAGYANTAYIGFPLMIACFGRDAGIYAMIASLLTVCLLFAVGIVVIETGLQQGAGGLAMARKVAGRVLRNPIVAAPILGSIFPLTGMAMPKALDDFVALLGSAASPAALVALGLFLGERRSGPAPSKRTTGELVLFKLVAQPVLTWVLATQVFHASTFETHAAVLIAALPTGTGPFMLAEFYGREAGTTARVILISTILSIATVSGYLAWIG